MASSQKASGDKRWYWAQLAASLAGTALSLYLMVQHTRVKSGIQGGASLCNMGRYANCDAVSTSAWSEIGGIPLAAVGALFYFILLMLGLIANPGQKGFRRSQWLVTWLATLALGIDLCLFGIQAIALKTFCLFCLGTYLCSAFVLWAALRMNEKRGTTGLFGVWRSSLGGHSVAGTSAIGVPSLVMAVVATGAFLALLAMVPSFVRTASPTNERIEDAMAQFFANWKRLPQRNIPYKDGDGSFGSPNAPVKIVVFSDFQCPFCRKAAFTMNTALANLKDRVFFVFKHFPLDASCNKSLQYQIHQHACQLAFLGYCARAKGKFWEYHDRIMFNLTESDLEKGMEPVQSGIKDILTPSEVAQCLASSQARANTEADVELGNSLGVHGTPAVFINGKPVTIPVTVEALQKLVQMEGG